MTLVITNCTNRKRKSVRESLHVSAVPQAPMDDLVVEWVRRLTAAGDVFPARAIYGGRSFREAALAAELLNGRLMIISAGLGLISADVQVPPYACTVLVNAPDGVASRVIGDYSTAGWWKALGAVSPFSQSLQQVATETDGLICAALSDAYIEMIADNLCALPVAMLARVRLFTRTPLHRVVPALRPFVMPYDDRLDGPDSLVRGTRGDFAARALRHFVEYVLVEGDGRSTNDHCVAVDAALAGWRMAARFDRQRLADDAVLDLIRKHWVEERGSAARLLRRLRDDLGIACEQRRLADLARQVRMERA